MEQYECKVDWCQKRARRINIIEHITILKACVHDSLQQCSAKVKDTVKLHKLLSITADYLFFFCKQDIHIFLVLIKMLFYFYHLTYHNIMLIWIDIEHFF